jgi:hypothetical protein
MRSPHVETNETELALWDAYLNAMKYRDIVYELSSRFYRLDNELEVSEATLPEALASLVHRGKELLADYEKLRAEANEAWNSAAWEYVAHAVDLNFGDQIEIDSPKGKMIFHCRYLQPEDNSDERDPAKLCVSGPVARKDGSPGKISYGSAKLFSDEWKLAGRARPEWLQQLRQFWPIGD